MTKFKSKKKNPNSTSLLICLIWEDLAHNTFSLVHNAVQCSSLKIKLDTKEHVFWSIWLSNIQCHEMTSETNSSLFFGKLCACNTHGCIKAVRKVNPFNVTSFTVFWESNKTLDYYFNRLSITLKICTSLQRWHRWTNYGQLAMIKCSSPSITTCETSQLKMCEKCFKVIVYLNEKTDETHVKKEH